MFLQDRFFQSRLLDATKTCGSYKPADVLCYIGESLTIDESKELEKFLKWLKANKRTFGWNLPEVVADYLKDKGK